MSLVFQEIGFVGSRPKVETCHMRATGRKMHATLNTVQTTPNQVMLLSNPYIHILLDTLDTTLDICGFLSNVQRLKIVNLPLSPVCVCCVQCAGKGQDGLVPCALGLYLNIL